MKIKFSQTIFLFPRRMNVKYPAMSLPNSISTEHLDHILRKYVTNPWLCSRKSGLWEPHHTKSRHVMSRHVTSRHAKPRQAKPSQAKPSQVKSSQAKPSQAKPRHATPSHATPHHTTPYHTTSHLLNCFRYTF